MGKCFDIIVVIIVTKIIVLGHMMRSTFMLSCILSPWCLTHSSHSCDLPSVGAIDFTILWPYLSPEQATHYHTKRSSYKG